MALDVDDARLHEALALAEQGFGLTEPNPRVGCVIADAQGSVIGRGSTQRAGEAHAEVMALRQARAAGADPRGGTAWVTLEPCAHHGRTPPCCDALIEAGLARVVVAVADPFPAVAGRGIARLRAAGITVDLSSGEIARAARAINIGFFSRIERGRPWVRLKMATSIDGFTALPDGRSQWITGPEARADGHAWRRRASAVLTGIGTALADDPRLDVRLVPTALQPLRIVLDPAGRLPPQARLYAPPGRVLHVRAQGQPPPAPDGAETEHWLLPDDRGRVDLRQLLARLAERGVNELHVEAGARLSGALLAAGLVDECLLYQAPRFLGRGRPLAELPAASSLDDAERWQVLGADRIGADLRIRLLAEASRSFTDPPRANVG